MAKNNKNLYDLLVDWRDDRARKENIPESKKYFIFPNSTLKNIAELGPKTAEELIKIKGIGSKKLLQYGNEILLITKDSIIEDFKQTEETMLFSEKRAENNVLSISQLNNRIKQVLNDSFNSGLWIHGELYRYELDVLKADARPYGQVYFELVEQDSATKERKATISAMIWGEERIRINEKLMSLTSGLVLKDGLHIKVKCNVDFYPPQGRVQIRITDIDPEYTIGKMALEKKLILEKLKKSGLLEKNKKIQIPLVPLKIGLITSVGSAAYNDFVDELKKSKYSFSIFVCDARMQGADLETEVRNSIYTLNKQDIDVIAIVRGGGSASDLMGFDKEGVAVAIAKSEKPVLTGIGHQIDRTIADEVSNQSFKTPTATAQFIVEKVHNFEIDYEEIFENILENQKQILINELERLKNISKQVKSATLMFTSKLEGDISQLNEKLKWNIKRIFDNSYRKLEELDRFINSKNPVNILKLGFGLVYGENNKIIKSIKNVIINTDIKVELRDGKLIGSVKSKDVL
ncbi:MAG: exodeoxyribonuclease VII large subunit [Elusimicrobia bacterium RIFOXYC2_FULL_34_12]|nr:MAG: exodeoxyribonuclease VII large subunit [Elusimicrobia bacterium RIFOXYC2_FULL_34_12]